MSSSTSPPAGFLSRGPLNTTSLSSTSSSSSQLSSTLAPCVLGAAISDLHPSRVPKILPCREREQANIEGFLQSCIENGRTGALHVCGSPGVGKTAVITSCLSLIQDWAEQNGHKAPGVVFMNGMSMDLDVKKLYASLSERVRAADARTGGKSQQASTPLSAQLADIDRLWTQVSSKTLSSSSSSSSSSSLSSSSTTIAPTLSNTVFMSRSSSSGSSRSSSASKKSPLSVSSASGRATTPQSVSKLLSASKTALLFSRHTVTQMMQHGQAHNQVVSSLHRHQSAPATVVLGGKRSRSVSDSELKHQHEATSSSIKREKNDAVLPPHMSSSSSSSSSSISHRTLKQDVSSSSSSGTQNTSQDEKDGVANGITCAKGATLHIVVVDETDALLSRSQEALYRLFLWPFVPGSRIILVSIANSVDMTERFLPRLRTHKLAPAVVVFRPYEHAQIAEIVTERLTRACIAAGFVSSEEPSSANDTSQQIHSQHIVDPKGIALVARKIAARDGDLRKALYLVRRAVQVASSRFCSKNHEIEERKLITVVSSSKDVGSLSTKTPFRPEPLRTSSPQTLPVLSSRPSLTEAEETSPVGSTKSEETRTGNVFEEPALDNVRDSILGLAQSATDEPPMTMTTGDISHAGAHHRCSCCSNGLAWSSKMSPSAITFAVPAVEILTLLSTVFDRNKFVKMLLALPRDGQLLICAARGLSEREAESRAQDAAFDRAKKSGASEAISGTFDGAGLNFAAIATTIGAFKEGRIGVTSSLLVGESTSAASASAAASGAWTSEDVAAAKAAAASTNKMATITIAQLRDCFVRLCRQRTQTTVEASDFSDLIDRLEADGIIAIVSGVGFGGLVSTAGNTNSGGALRIRGASRTLGPGGSSSGGGGGGGGGGGSWLHQQLRLNVCSADLEFAFGDKPFFQSIYDDARKGK